MHHCSNFTKWAIEMSSAGATGVTGGFEASGGSPEPRCPKRPAGLSGTAQLSKWKKKLGKHNLDLIGHSDTLEFIKMGETLKASSALWESAAVRCAAAATCLFGCLVFTHSSSRQVALQDPYQGGLISATPCNNNLLFQSVNE